MMSKFKAVLRDTRSQRHGTITCLSVVAVLSLGALMASAAEAVPPEYGQCRALTSLTTPKVKHGKFDDANCQKLYMKHGKVYAHGDFEWYPGPPANCIAEKKGAYTDSACTMLSAKLHGGAFERQKCYPNCARYTGTGKETAAFMDIDGFQGVYCPGGTASDEITGPTTTIYIGTFTECNRSETHLPCKGIGASVPAGEIATTPLITELGQEIPGTTPLSFELTGKNTDDIDAEFICEGDGYWELTGPLANGVTQLGGTFGDGDEMNNSSELELVGEVTAHYYTTEAKLTKKEVTSTVDDVFVRFRNEITGAPVEVNGTF
jgi:hypothetical protein